MAVRKLRSGRFQAWLRDPDGYVLSRTFDTRLEAEEYELKLKREKHEGKLLEQIKTKWTVEDLFRCWLSQQGQSVSGWILCRVQQYRDYVHPVIGHKRLASVSRDDVRRVLHQMAELGRGSSLQTHVYGLLRMLFREAIEEHELVTFNPVKPSLKPKLAVKEAKHLNLNQATRLLAHVDGKKYGLAIWIQLYLGLRLGELQALRWENVDLESGRLWVRRVYVRKTNQFRDYPKGRKQHVCTIPGELLERLREAARTAKSELVVESPAGEFVVPYKYYRPALRKYCREVGIPEVATHGLRHSTAELYQAYGAQKDDLRELFAHSSLAVTERYVHGRNGGQDRVAKIIRLFPEANEARK